MVVTVGVVFAVGFFTQTRGVVTTETRSDGSEESVDWRGYPAVAGLGADAVLEAPSLEEGRAMGDETIGQIREELSASFSLVWGQEKSRSETITLSQNEFGGESMLYTVNETAWRSSLRSPTQDNAQAILRIMERAAEHRGFPETHLDARSDEEDPPFLAGVFAGQHGQWLSFSIGVPPGDGPDEDTPAVTISYGANALLAEADRAEFRERIRPYLPYEQPDPLTT